VGPARKCTLKMTDFPHVFDEIKLKNTSSGQKFILEAYETLPDTLLYLGPHPQRVGARAFLAPTTPQPESATMTSSSASRILRCAGCGQGLCAVVGCGSPQHLGRGEAASAHNYWRTLRGHCSVFTATAATTTPEAGNFVTAMHTPQWRGSPATTTNKASCGGARLLPPRTRSTIITAGTEPCASLAGSHPTT